MSDEQTRILEQILDLTRERLTAARQQREEFAKFQSKFITMMFLIIISVFLSAAAVIASR